MFSTREMALLAGIPHETGRYFVAERFVMPTEETRESVRGRRKRFDLSEVQVAAIMAQAVDLMPTRQDSRDLAQFLRHAKIPQRLEEANWLLCIARGSSFLARARPFNPKSDDPEEFSAIPDQLNPFKPDTPAMGAYRLLKIEHGKDVVIPRDFLDLFGATAVIFAGVNLREAAKHCLTEAQARARLALVLGEDWKATD